ncbi:MAG TPA: NAD(P)H-dependent oxidoreductase [Gemmataceae bacterium]|jgi:multimeric flavodoxin WrbA|nr:NAD(P)H-dependent oxidoreductase [Gemmataceae bacterium]
MNVKILGLSASLRNARRGGGNHDLIAELMALNTKDELFDYLKNQAKIHLANFVDSGRKEGLAFDELYKNLKKLKGDKGLSNSEIALAAALWSAKELGAEIEHLSLSEYFPEHGRVENVDELKEKMLACDGLLLSGPVYFGDRGSLAQSVTDLIREDPELREGMKGKVYGGIAVGAKRNGGQETTLIYQLIDMINIGFLGVGNDSETTSQYGGTGHAGDIGTMPNDVYGLDTSMGCGRRVTRIAATLQLAAGKVLQDRPHVSFWVLQDKEDRAYQFVDKMLTSGRFPIQGRILRLAEQNVVRCLACDVCPTNVDMDGVYRCIIKTKTDALRNLHSDLIEGDAIIPVVYSTQDRTGLISRYQEFIERTRYLRRGDYVFSDTLCAPLVVEELGAGDNMQIRMMTSMLRHHTIITKPMTAYLHNGAYINEEQVWSEMDEFLAQAKRTTVGRMLTAASGAEHLKYNPVGYVLAAMKDAEDVKMKRRKEMIDNRMARARAMVSLRLLSDDPAEAARRAAI